MKFTWRAARVHGDHSGHCKDAEGEEEETHFSSETVLGSSSVGCRPRSLLQELNFQFEFILYTLVFHNCISWH